MNSNNLPNDSGNAPSDFQADSASPLAQPHGSFNDNFLVAQQTGNQGQPPLPGLAPQQATDNVVSASNAAQVEITRLTSALNAAESEEAQEIGLMDMERVRLERELLGARGIQSQQAARISELAEENTRLQSQLRASQTGASIAETALARSFKLEQELVIKTEEHGDLQRRLTVSQGQLSIQAQRIEGLEEANGRLQREANIAAAKYALHQRSIRILEDENTVLRRGLTTSQHRENASLAASANQRNRIGILEGANARLQREASIAAAEHALHQRSISILEDENTDLRRGLTTSQHRENASLAANANQQNRIGILERDNDALRRKLEASQKRADSYFAEKTRLQELVRKLNIKITSLMTDSSEEPEHGEDVAGPSGVPRDINGRLIPPIFEDNHGDYLREDSTARQRNGENKEEHAGDYGRIREFDEEEEGNQDFAPAIDVDPVNDAADPAPPLFVLFKGAWKTPDQFVDVSQVKKAMEFYTLPGTYNNKRPNRRPEGEVGDKFPFLKREWHFRQLRVYEREGIVPTTDEYNHSVALELTRRAEAVGQPVREADLREMVDQVVTDMQIPAPYAFDDSQLAKWKIEHRNLWA